MALLSSIRPFAIDVNHTFTPGTLVLAVGIGDRIEP